MSGKGFGGVRRFDHAGVVVDDLELVTEFFVALGFEKSGPMRIEGEWVDRVVGLEGVHADMVNVNAPDGSGRLELTKFHRPTDSTPVRSPLSNSLGFRHLAYIVDDVESVVERVRAKGYEPVGDLVNYEDIFLMAYIGGPEGLIVEVAEEISGN
jgi:catechol 2,3-dioxygenase-like lactoylglutathione lyase family enzyme